MIIHFLETMVTKRFYTFFRNYGNKKIKKLRRGGGKLVLNIIKFSITCLSLNPKYYDEKEWSNKLITLILLRTTYTHAY